MTYFVARKQFKDTDLKVLLTKSRGLCAFENCNKNLVLQDIFVGDICHIEAAEPEGPRFNNNQDDDERRGIDNLILLCKEHHKLIDRDPLNYFVTHLKI